MKIPPPWDPRCFFAVRRGRVLPVMLTPDRDYLSKPNKPAARGNGDAVCFK